MQTLNIVGEMARETRPPRPGERSAEVLEGVPVAFRPVHLSWYSPLLGWMIWFYSHRREPVPVLQVVWPDKESRFPWDAAFDPRYRDDQPELWRPAGEQPQGRWQQLQEELTRPFGLPSDAAVLTTRRILDGATPILGVVHDEDGSWQFLDGGRTKAKDAALVHVQHLIGRDPSLADVPGLPCGWEAWRAGVGSPWKARPLPGQR